MKKTLLILTIAVLLFVFSGCGISANELSSLYENLTNTQLQIDGLVSDLAYAETQIETLESELATVTAERDELAAQLEGAGNSEFGMGGGVSAPDDGTFIHDDEYVTIGYLGCEINDWDEFEMFFYVVNKTDAELTFQADSLAVDGEDLGYVGGSDHIAPQSRGSISFYTDEVFPMQSPSTISGVISVIDFEEETLPSFSYPVSFINIEVESGEDAPMPTGDLPDPDDVPIPSGGTGATISKAEYDQLEEGMSYEEVCAIIGGEGEALAESGTFVMYMWPGEGSIGANANATFMDGEMISKAQYGLS
ncbi:MAG: hypothetical protein ACOYJB_01515 [Christensenellaceae bacterium]|jgi:hypothetical protein